MATTTTTASPPAAPLVPDTPVCFVSPAAIAYILSEAPARPLNPSIPANINWQALATLKLLFPTESAELVVLGLPQAQAIIHDLATAAIRLRGWHTR